MRLSHQTDKLVYTCRRCCKSYYASLNWPSGIVNIVDNYPATSKEWLPIYAAAIGHLSLKFKMGKIVGKEELPIIRHVKSMVDTFISIMV